MFYCDSHQVISNFDSLGIRISKIGFYKSLTKRVNKILDIKKRSQH